MKRISLPARRAWLKVLHWSVLPLLVWFMLMQPRDVARWGDWAVSLHSMEFHALAVVAGFHALYHIWRHYALRDNALRIMAPKAMQRFP